MAESIRPGRGMREIVARPVSVHERPPRSAGVVCPGSLLMAGNIGTVTVKVYGGTQGVVDFTCIGIKSGGPNIDNIVVKNYLQFHEHLQRQGVILTRSAAQRIATGVDFRRPIDLSKILFNNKEEASLSARTLQDLLDAASGSDSDGFATFGISLVLRDVSEAFPHTIESLRGAGIKYILTAVPTLAFCEF